MVKPGSPGPVATEVLHPPAALVPQRRDGAVGLHFYSLGGCSLQELGSQLYGYPLVI